MKNLLVILLTFILLFVITLLLDIPWIQAKPVRQYLVYLLMAAVIAVSILINKQLIKDLALKK